MGLPVWVLTSVEPLQCMAGMPRPGRQHPAGHVRPLAPLPLKLHVEGIVELAKLVQSAGNKQPVSQELIGVWGGGWTKF